MIVSVLDIKTMDEHNASSSSLGDPQMLGHHLESTAMLD